MVAAAPSKITMKRREAFGRSVYFGELSVCPHAGRGRYSPLPPRGANNLAQNARTRGQLLCDYGRWRYRAPVVLLVNRGRGADGVYEIQDTSSVLNARMSYTTAVIVLQLAESWFLLERLSSSSFYSTGSGARPTILSVACSTAQ